MEKAPFSGPQVRPDVNGYFLRIQQAVDALRARQAGLAAEDDAGRVARYFLLRAIDLGEASFRTGEISLPQEVLGRTLCEDFIQLFWATRRRENTAQLAGSVLSENGRFLGVLLGGGYGRVTLRETGEDRTAEFAKNARDGVAPRLKLDRLAKEAGLVKLYDVAYRFGSLSAHARTPDLDGPRWNPPSRTVAALSLVESLLECTALLIDRPTLSAGQVLDLLGLARLGRR